MSAINFWRLATLALALALVWALTRGPGTLTPEQWVEAQAQNRARELSEIEAEARFKPGEDFYQFSTRQNARRAARAELCPKREQ